MGVGWGVGRRQGGGVGKTGRRAAPEHPPHPPPRRSPCSRLCGGISAFNPPGGPAGQVLWSSALGQQGNEAIRPV